MPEWLLTDENYEPQTDKDTFINKSILTILGIISRIRAQSGYKPDRFYVSAVLKVAFTFFLVILLSLSKSLIFVALINIYLLFVLSMLKASEILRILRGCLLVASFTVVILLPAALWGNYYSLIMVTPKVFASVMAVNILSRSTQWTSITSALKNFFVPDLFIFVIDITIKYIMLLGDFALNMLYSLKLRSVGKNSNKYTSLSGISGTMFIKSKEMAEEMYTAMECRGFSGEYHIYRKYKFSLADLVFIIINIFILFAFLYLG